MLLRDHPLMVHKGNRSWSPACLWRGGHDNLDPTGEVGTLRDVIPSALQAADIFFIIMEHQGAEYLDALLLSDAVFCKAVCDMLLRHRLTRFERLPRLSYTL